MGLELHHATRHTYIHTKIYIYIYIYIYIFIFIYIGVGMQLQTCGHSNSGRWPRTSGQGGYITPLGAFGAGAPSAPVGSLGSYL